MVPLNPPPPPKNHRPILRCSICTGEQVAGYTNLRTGKFEEAMLVRDDRELREFMERYGISEIHRKY
ncbi:MAG: aspartate dehydrogenase [Acetatifactor sp.]|nr:aspartate dehydrogenase [Acetatifactor sp.]